MVNYSTVGDGWTCSNCGAFVFWNLYHQCPQINNYPLQGWTYTVPSPDVDKKLDEILKKLDKLLKEMD